MRGGCRGDGKQEGRVVVMRTCCGGLVRQALSVPNRERMV